MKVVLIGGGESGRGNTTYETEEIDQEIVKMSEKEHPNLLFIGLASAHADSYYDLIKNNFKKLGCNPVYLKKSNLINNPDLVKDKFQNADIIYIGGGDTLKLLERIEEYRLKGYFKDALERNTVLAGISSGAILLAKEGYSDSYILRGEKDTYEFVQGLNFVPYSICPHYHKDEEKTKALKQSLKGKDKKVYGLENGTALIIEDYSLRVIHSIKNAKAYEVSYIDEFLEKEIRP